MLTGAVMTLEALFDGAVRNGAIKEKALRKIRRASYKFSSTSSA
jgi:hypothetical protein